MFTIRCRLESVTSSARPASAAYSRIRLQRSRNSGAGVPSVCQPSASRAIRRSTRSSTAGSPPSTGFEAIMIGTRAWIGFGSAWTSSNA